MKALALLFLFISYKGQAQTEELQVKGAIETLFRGMRTSDTTMMRTVLSSSASLQTITGTSGQNAVRAESIDGFLASIAKPHPEPYDERITFGTVHIDGALASVWTPYRFYVGNTFSHCGVNSFQLVKLAGAWKIQYIIDTRRKTGCL